MNNYISRDDYKLSRKHFELIEKCPLAYKYRFLDKSDDGGKQAGGHTGLKKNADQPNVDSISAEQTGVQNDNIYLKLFALVEPAIIDFHKKMTYMNIKSKSEAGKQTIYDCLEKTRGNIKNMNIDAAAFSKAMKMIDVYYEKFLPDKIEGISVKEFLILRYDKYYFYNIINRIDTTEKEVILYFFKVGNIPANKSFLINDIRNQSAALAALQSPAFNNKKITLQMLYLDSGESIEIIPEQKNIMEYERRIKEDLYNISVMENSADPAKSVIKLSDNYIFRGKKIHFDQCSENLELAKASGGCPYCDFYLNGKCEYWKIKPYDRCGENYNDYSKRLKLSYSKYSGFKHCQYSWKLRYLDKIPSKPQPFFDLGHSVHETLEKYYDKFDKTPRTKEYLLKIFEVEFDKFKEGYSNEEEKNRYYENGKKMIEKYYNSFVKDKEFKPAYFTESYFELPIGKNVNMNGYIDRIDDAGNNFFEILDYKTEPTDRTQDDVDSDDQLSIYFWACENMFGKKIENVSLFMMEFDKKISTSTVINRIGVLLEDIDKTAEIIISKTSEYEKKIKENISGCSGFNENTEDLKKKISLEIFPPSINKYCRSCDFLSDCVLKEKILSDDSIVSMEK
ncbi:MAG TPA: PD-(D/E)XK nuclease family protein [bacterium]|nr:PD-(D/E)XK nuclease family protein [bacterium]